MGIYQNSLLNRLGSAFRAGGFPSSSVNIEEVDRKAGEDLISNDPLLSTVLPLSEERGRMVSGAYIKTPGNTISGQAMTLNQLYASKLFIPVTFQFNQFAINVTAGGTAGSVVRVGLYTDGADNRPNSLVVDGGTIPTTAIGVQGSGAVNMPFQPPGWYWLAAVAQVAAPTISFFTTSPANRSIVDANSAILFANPIGNFQIAGVAGALPASFGAPSANGTNGPVIAGRLV